LKPADEANYYFFEIVRELLDASFKNFNELRRGRVTGNLNLIAWASRNLLELTIFTKYVLKSGANARRFGDDRLVDGCELITALRDLERHHELLRLLRGWTTPSSEWKIRRPWRA